MFMAHSGAALVTKKADERIPVAICLTAAWAFDLTGVGHWAPVAALFAAFAFGFGVRRWDVRAGVVLAGTVIAHDVLDLVVGVQLMPGGRYLGANLSGRDHREVALECAVVVLGWVLWRSMLADRSVLPLMPLLAMGAIIGAHALTEQPTSTHRLGVVQGAVLIAGLVTSWATIIVADRRGRPVPAHP